jgi:hypothetical protein
VTDRAEDIDPLEAELTAMRPAEPSPELYAGVEHALAQRPGKWRVVTWLPALGAAAAAAIVTVGFRHRMPNDAPPAPVIAVAPSTFPAARDADRPALANYRGAADLSAAELDDLLDRHAARSLAGGTAGTARAGSLSRLGLR